MTLRLAASFTDALMRLTAQEMAAVWSTVTTLNADPSHPGLKLHRVDRARDKNFWTARVNDGIRIVLHRAGEDTLLWVDHHDAAYRWAERRRLDVHPVTGAAQLVEVRERVEEVVVPVYVTREAARPKLFADTPDKTLLLCGVPEDWIADVRTVDEDTIFALQPHLPAEAMEALVDLAYGIAPKLPAPTPDPFAHPDAQRRFRLLTDEADLARALEAPWERWAIFLHPAQQEFVDRDFAGPARVIGSAGTGKTVVALHRAVRLAREGGRVLLTTFNSVLAASLERKLALLSAGDEAFAARITVADLATATRGLHEATIGPVTLATDFDIREALVAAKGEVALKVDDRFLLDEWTLIVDGRQIRSRENYRDLPRLGRKRRLSGEKREALWSLFERARETLGTRGLTTYPAMLAQLGASIDPTASPFDHVVVDEAQDIGAVELRILARIAGGRPNGLFFAGDIGQRIFRPPFSWKGEGVDVTGRSRALRVNYRTSEAIRRRADRLLPPTLVEADGAEESRKGVQSLFTGPPPEHHVYGTEEQERDAVAAWLRTLIAAGLPPGTIALIVRSDTERPRAEAAAAIAELPCSGAGGGGAGVVVATMHEAKGLEYRAVAVLACDEGVLPSVERLAEAADESALAEVYATERHLLYVAATRAREALLVTAVAPASEFLDDLASVK